MALCPGIIRASSYQISSVKSVLSAHSSEWNVQVQHTITITITVTNKVQAKKSNQLSWMLSDNECYQIILSIVHLAMSNCKFFLTIMSGAGQPCGFKVVVTFMSTIENFPKILHDI